jgi:hypothetical protein
MSVRWFGASIAIAIVMGVQAAPSFAQTSVRGET